MQQCNNASHSANRSQNPSQGYQLPRNPDLWYNRNSELLYNEQIAMAQVCPEALLGLLQTNGTLYWLVTLPLNNVPCQFMLLYKNNFPEYSVPNPSVVIIPMNPQLPQLRKLLREDSAMYFGRYEELSTDRIRLVPGCYHTPTAADYYTELARWLDVNRKN